MILELTLQISFIWFFWLWKRQSFWCQFPLLVAAPVHPKGDQSWIFTGRTDAEAEAPTLWPRDTKSWLIWKKNSEAGKDWGQEEKGMTEDEMVRWHHRLNGHGFGWTPGVSDGQGGLVCCSSWGRRESDTTEQLNWTIPTPTPRFSSGSSLSENKRKHRNNGQVFTHFFLSSAAESVIEPQGSKIHTKTQTNHKNPPCCQGTFRTSNSQLWYT